MVYFLRGKLPWQGLKTHGRDKDQVVMEKKAATSHGELCEGLPAEFARYMDEVAALSNKDTPDYSKLRDMFRQLASTRSIEYDNFFDWTERWFGQNASASDTESEGSYEGSIEQPNRPI